MRDISCTSACCEVLLLLLGAPRAVQGLPKLSKRDKASIGICRAHIRFIGVVLGSQWFDPFSPADP